MDKFIEILEEPFVMRIVVIAIPVLFWFIYTVAKTYKETKDEEKE